MKIAIYGYGNLGKGVECAIAQREDMELFGVFTRRNPSELKTLTGAAVYPASEVTAYKNDIDVLIICGGSATDLPVMTPALAADFNVVDSFDTHANIPAHFAAVDAAARKGGKLAVISCGWDPGLFSINRVYAGAILPDGKDFTFWGRGVSQGHSDAVRRIPGVKDARQYTVPKEEAVAKARDGYMGDFTAREKHLRECYVVAEEGADLQAIEEAIRTMPNYFDEYDTTVEFITEEEMKKNHSQLPHGGFVIRSGLTGLDKENTETIEYKLTLDSNPQFTASVLACVARAAAKMQSRGETGCRTILDIAPADFSPLSREELLHLV